MKKQQPWCISCRAKFALRKKNFCYECEQIEVKAKKREYRQKPEVKAKQREKREYMREYRQKPEVKAKQREYFQKPEVKAKKREYRQKPEVKAKKSDKEQLKKIYKEYAILLQKMDKQKLSVREMRRLEALAEYLGRDIDEWRTEQQKKEYMERMEEKY
jgi:DNA/RNA endonuclease YhcR with UshA esterase domain